MATLIIPTKRVFARPILLDAKQLLQLDQTVDRCAEKLFTDSERQLTEKTTARAKDSVEKYGLSEERAQAEEREWLKSRGWGVETRTLTVNLSRGRQLEVQNFTEALEHTELDVETPLGFSLYYKTGDHKIVVDLDMGWTDELLIETKPNDSELSQAVFGSLSNWARDVVTPIWQQKWFVSRGLFRFVLWMCFFFGVLLFFASYRQTRTQSANEAEAYKLLQQGIDSSNEKQAISLILAIESDYGATIDKVKSIK